MKISFTGIAFFIILFLNATRSFAQHGYDHVEENKKFLLQKDFLIFRDSLQQIHPALYRYTAKEEMNHLFDSCFASINNNTTDIEFFLLVKFMIRMVDDGHLLGNLPKEKLQNQLANAKVFPFRLWFIDDKAYVLCAKDDRFKPGTEILSVNGKSVNDLRKMLFRYLASDADIQSRKYVALNANEASFQFLYYWIYGEKDSVQIEYKAAENKIASATIATAVVKNDNCFFEKKVIDKYLSLDFKSDNIALLTIRTFAMGKLNQEESYFKVYLDSVFQKLKSKNVSKLIIDVRDNGGGEDHNGSILYSYLTDKPFAYYSALSTISEELPKEIHSNLEIQQPQKNNYKGKCFFLINGKSFSTTSEFTAIAKSNNRGIFIGEETGGGYYGNTGSEQAIFSLPFSGIRMIIPKRKYTLAVKETKNKNIGTIPDFTIVPSITDVINGNDVQLDYALKLAAEK